MADNDSSKFKIRFDDDNNDSPNEGKSAAPAVEQVENLQLQKLRRKINRVAFWISCLVLLLLLFAYLDVRKRLDAITDSGAPNILTLSKELDSKFSSLSIRQARVEALIDEKIAAMQKAAALLAKELDQTEKALAGLRATTPDKQALAGTVLAEMNKKMGAELDKRIAPVGADMEKMAAEFKKLSTEEKALKDRFEKRFDSLAASLKDLSAASAALKKETEALRVDAAALAAGKVDKMSFDLAIRHEERFYQQKLDGLEKALSQKIQEVRDQLGTPKQKSSEVVPPAKRQTSASGAPSPEKIEPSVPEPGKIVEQELRN